MGQSRPNEAIDFESALTSTLDISLRRITVTPISRPLVKGREYFFGGASRQFCHWLLQAAVFEPRPFLRFVAVYERRIAPDTHQDQARVRRWPAPRRRCRSRRTLVARRIQSNLTVPWLPACRRQSPDGLRCVRSAFTAAGDGDPASNSVQLAATPVTVPRACSVSAETDHALDSLFGRIFYGKPVSTFPENALAHRIVVVRQAKQRVTSNGLPSFRM
jgi:hypothetical protein